MKVSFFVCFCPSSPSPRLECKLHTGRARWTFFLKLPSLHFRKFPGPTSEFLTINLLSGSGCSPCWCWTRWAQPLAGPSQYSYNIEWSAGHTMWAGENCYLALWKLPSSFRKSPFFSQKLLSSSDTPRRLDSEDQGMTRVIPLHPPPFPTSGMSSFTDTLGRGWEGMGMNSCPVDLDLSPTALPPGKATCR